MKTLNHLKLYTFRVLQTDSLVFKGQNFRSSYGSCEETEDLDYHKDIIPSLLEVCREIEVQTVNMQTGSHTYPDPEDRSRHVIAIGGLALSRGLTLEGLSITYILRNASPQIHLCRWADGSVIDRVIKI